MEYIISDTHFYHDAIYRYCDRPRNCEELMKKNMMSINPEDILIHLGDIGLHQDQLIHDELLSKMKCKKILVRGNHDSKSDSWYYNNGWDFVCDSFTLNKYGAKIIFSHKPLYWNGEWSLNIHGHLHNLIRIHDDRKITTPFHYLLSVELNGYKAEKLPDIVNIIKSKNPPIE